MFYIQVQYVDKRIKLLEAAMKDDKMKNDRPTFVGTGGFRDYFLKNKPVPFFALLEGSFQKQKAGIKSCLNMSIIVCNFKKIEMRKYY